MQAATGIQVKSATVRRPRRFVFVLLDQFSMLSFAGAVESLRIANRAKGETIYLWDLLGEDGHSVTCSNGAAFALDGAAGGIGGGTVGGGWGARGCPPSYWSSSSSWSTES